MYLSKYSGLSPELWFWIYWYFVYICAVAGTGAFISHSLFPNSNGECLSVLISHSLHLAGQRGTYTVHSELFRLFESGNESR